MIVKNNAFCMLCNTEVESHHRHDYVRCLCGNLAVDGGMAYLRRNARDTSMVKDTSIVKDEEL